MIDTSNMTKARYQPIFFVPAYTKIEGMRIIFRFVRLINHESR